MIAQLLLAAVVAWTAWFPVETSPTTAIVLAILVLALVPWIWARCGGLRPGANLVALAALLVFFVLSAANGWDPATSVCELALAAAISVLLLASSREASPELLHSIFAFAVASLSLWAVWQVAAGFERDFAAISELPDTLQTYAEIRLQSGRAFASQILPGHLAVLLATVLPLFVSGLRRRPWLSWTGLALCVVGLYLTYSALGIALAAGSCVALIVGRRRGGLRALMAVLVVLVVLAAGALMARPDLADLEPLRLRTDNWRTALWLWSTAPVTGVGLGSYGQASQAVPFAVGNRPVHAHCLPLEWLAELGLVGLGLFLIATCKLASIIRDLWRERPGLAVAIAVVPLHNLADFSLYTSGVAIPWALLTGWAVAATRSDEPSPSPASGRPWAVALAALALVVVCLHSTSAMLEWAYSDLQDPAETHAAAMRANRLAPWRVGPVTMAAAAALEDGDPSAIAAAHEVLHRSRWLRPESTTLAASRSRVCAARGLVSEAAGDAWAAAYAQGPKRAFGEELNGLLEQIEGRRDGD